MAVTRSIYATVSYLLPLFDQRRTADVYNDTTRETDPSAEAHVLVYLEPCPSSCLSKWHHGSCVTVLWVNPHRHCPPGPWTSLWAFLRMPFVAQRLIGNKLPKRRTWAKKKPASQSSSRRAWEISNPSQSSVGFGSLPGIAELWMTFGAFWFLEYKRSAASVNSNETNGRRREAIVRSVFDTSFTFELDKYLKQRFIL